jgi:hypothetical protein
LTRGGGEGDANLRAASGPVVPDLGADHHSRLLRALERAGRQPNAPVEDFTLDQFRFLRGDYTLGLSRSCRTRSFCSRSSVSKSARYWRWAR